MNAALFVGYLLLLGVATMQATPKELQALETAFNAIGSEKHLSVAIEKILILQRVAETLKDNKYESLKKSINSYAQAGATMQAESEKQRGSSEERACGYASFSLAYNMMQINKQKVKDQIALFIH